MPALLCLFIAFFLSQWLGFDQYIKQMVSLNEKKYIIFWQCKMTRSREDEKSVGGIGRSD